MKVAWENLDAGKFFDCGWNGRVAKAVACYRTPKLLHQHKLDGIYQRAPAGFDDVFADADGAPALAAIAASMLTRMRAACLRDH